MHTIQPLFIPKKKHFYVYYNMDMIMHIPWNGQGITYNYKCSIKY